MNATIWHGTQSESFELVAALSRNCSCEVAADGTRLKTCAPHQMLIDDQRALDGLLYARRIRHRLLKEEGHA